MNKTRVAPVLLGFAAAVNPASATKLMLRFYHLSRNSISVRQGLRSNELKRAPALRATPDTER